MEDDCQSKLVSICLLQRCVKVCCFQDFVCVFVYVCQCGVAMWLCAPRVSVCVRVYVCVCVCVSVFSILSARQRETVYVRCDLMHSQGSTLAHNLNTRLPVHSQGCTLARNLKKSPLNLSTLTPHSPIKALCYKAPSLCISLPWSQQRNSKIMTLTSILRQYIKISFMIADAGAYIRVCAFSHVCHTCI